MLSRRVFKSSMVLPLWLVMCCHFLTGEVARGADPKISGFRPFSVQRGVEVELTIIGDRLTDAQELFSHDPGIEVLSLTVPDSNEGKQGKQLKAKIKTAENARLGQYRMRLRTATGMSAPIMFTLCHMPTLEEKEPNSEFSSPQPAELGKTIQGRIDNEDADYYIIEAKKGQRVTAEVEGFRLGVPSDNTFFDPYVAILNELRFELDYADDTPLLNKDCFVSVIIPEDGKYTIVVRDSSYKGGGNYFYNLHVGDFPRPLSVLPAGGKPGEEIDFTLIGDVKGEIRQMMKLPLDERERNFGIYAVDGTSQAPSVNRLMISPHPWIIEQEPNNSPQEANTLTTYPVVCHGIITEHKDRDYFKIKLSKDQEIEIDCKSRRLRSALDSVVDVWKANGQWLKAEDDKAGLDSILRFKAPEEGEYVISVRDHLHKGGLDYFYALEIKPVTPKLSITTNEISQYVQPDIVVPRKARYAFLVNASRIDCGGPVVFSAENLPAGVTFETPADWQNDGTIPLMIHADEGANLSQSLVLIKGEIKQGDKASITGILEQPYLMIRYNGNNRYMVEDLDRLAVTVAEELPFDIEIVPPQAPVVRNGSKKIKVIAKKKEGWDEKIDIKLLQNPPGVNSTTNVAIEKGQTEAFITINAAGNAQAKETPCTVLASAPGSGARLEISSPFTKIKVAEEFFKLEFQQAAVEQGQAVDFVVKVQQIAPFEGVAKCVLEGLPHNAKAEPVEINKDTQEFVFHITTQPDTNEGTHKTLTCMANILINGEEVEHRFLNGRLRVDKPPPPKVMPATPKPDEKKEVAKVEPAPTPPKPLSRLEKLRLEQEEKRREEAAGN